MGTFRKIIDIFILALIFDYTLAELKECFAWSYPKFIDVPENSHNSCSYDCPSISAIAVKADEYMFFTIQKLNQAYDTAYCALAYVNITTDLGDCESPLSPELACFPSFAANQPDPENCDNIVSIYKGIKVDNCNRLWVADSGIKGPLEPSYVQVCPPRIRVFDLATHQKLRMFTLPPSVLAAPDQDPTYFADVTIDNGRNCDETYFYMVDRIGLIVYSWKKNDAWRFEHEYFRPDLLQGIFYYGNIRVEWQTGINSISETDFVDSSEFRTLYFRPFANTKEFSVSTEVLHNKTASLDINNKNFEYVGDREHFGLLSFETISKNTGAMFFGAVLSNSTGCWNIENPYNPSYFHTVATGQEFPSYHSLFTLDESDVLCVLTNKLPQYLYGKLDYSDGVKNFVISCDKVENLISNTVCESKINF